MKPELCSPVSSRQPLDPRRIELLDPRVVEILRRKTPQERWQKAFEAHRLTRQMLACHFRGLHPDWSEAQIADAVAGRMLYGSTRVPAAPDHDAGPA